MATYENGAFIIAEPRIEGRLRTGERDPLLRVLIAVIGIHSTLLGIILLSAPRFMLQTFGFSATGSMFFPSQSGIFLLILGVCYLLALREPAYINVILISKAFAVSFLFAQAAFFSAPPSTWAMFAGDATMLLLLCAALIRHNRRRDHTNGFTMRTVP